MSGRTKKERHRVIKKEMGTPEKVSIIFSTCAVEKLKVNETYMCTADLLHCALNGAQKFD